MALKPKLVAVALIGATLALGTGTALIAEHPSPSRAATALVRSPARDAPSQGPTPAVTTIPPTPPAVGTAPTTKPAPPTAGTPKPSTLVNALTYTEHEGDTAASIAKWFRLHGEGALYTNDASVIDSYLRLIVPGTLISVAHDRFYIQFPD